MITLRKPTAVRSVVTFVSLVLGFKLRALFRREDAPHLVEHQRAQLAQAASRPFEPLDCGQNLRLDRKSVV